MSTDTVSISHPTGRPNLSVVHVGTLSVGFSYKTPVWVSGPAGHATVQNYWGPTTGKHLNYFNSRKDERVDAETFDRIMSANLAAAGLDRVTV